MRNSKIAILVALVIFAFVVPTNVRAALPVSVMVSPSTQVAPQGATVTYSVTLTGAQNPNGQYALGLSGLYSGQYVFSPSTVTVDGSGSGVSTLMVDTSNLPGLYCPGSYPFTVTAKYAGAVPPGVADQGTSPSAFLTVSQVGPPLSVTVSTDKANYIVGEKVTILVSVNKAAEGYVQISPPGGATQVFNFNSNGPETLPKTLTAQNVGQWRVFVQADDYCNLQTSATATFDVSPNTYDVSISLSGIASSVTVNLQVDSQSAGSMLGSEIKTLTFKIGTQHTVTVDQYVQGDTGVRYYAAQNTWSVSSTGTHTFEYQTQYLLTIATDPDGITQVSGSGWYSSGTSVPVGQLPQTLNGTEGARYNFMGWSLDGSMQTGNSISVTMDKAHKLTAKYTTQYQLIVDSPGGLGNPQGSGFYDAGSAAQFSVTSPVGVLVQQVFAGWQGDYTETSPQGTIVMDKPHIIHATWTTSYMQLYIVAGAVAVVAVVAALLMLRRRKGAPETKPMPPEAEIPPSPPSETPESPGPPTESPPPEEGGQVETGAAEVSTGVTEVSTESNTCTSCGASVPVGQIYCHNCGAKVE